MRVRGHTLVWHDADSGLGLQRRERRAADADAREQGAAARSVSRTTSARSSRISAADVVRLGRGQRGRSIQTSPTASAAARGSTSSGRSSSTARSSVAREVAPNAKLYINDFSTTNPTKRQFLVRARRDLKSRGVPIDGVGHQMHNNVDFPSGQAIVERINLFHGLGVEERDHRAGRQHLQRTRSPARSPTTSTFPAERFVLQGYRYRTSSRRSSSCTGKIKSRHLLGSGRRPHLARVERLASTRRCCSTSPCKKKHAYWGIVDPLQLPGADLSTTLTATSPSVAAGQARRAALSPSRTTVTKTQRRTSRPTTICRPRRFARRARCPRAPCSSRCRRRPGGRARRPHPAAAGRSIARSIRSP